MNATKDMKINLRGEELLHDPTLNKGTAFTEAEREALGIHGLLPPRVCTQGEQVRRVMENYHSKPNDMEKFVYLTALHDRNETLYFRVLMDNMEEMMPIVYTPTVGKACQSYGHIFRRARGMFISKWDRGRIRQVLRNWPAPEVGVIVVTDGERILGLGDLGANGMGIPIGKLSLYTACAGVPPTQCLPITLDVGTENTDLIEDPLYLGISQPRLRGEEYDEFIDEFVTAVQEVFPHAVLQFEDFANVNAFRLLRKYRDRVCTFNDDIQGTGAVTLAGLLSAARITGTPLHEQKVLFVGAGEAGIGIADTIVAAMMEEGLRRHEAMSRCWFLDSKGLVVRDRPGLESHKKPYAQAHEPVADLKSVIEEIRPTAIIGVSGRPQTFTREILSTMAAIRERPIVFALSNPTSKSECTATQAYRWTAGRAVFASGSPFPAVEFDNRVFVPGQGNNAYIFPGVGLGVIASRARRVTDEMFLAAARALADATSEHDLALGRVYPPLRRIREVSASIATAVARVAYARDLAGGPEPADLERHVREGMYEPVYRRYV
ncbi:MAG: oxaloacetate-decarboxylating malate dehydrogenase [Acidobacteria bacterium]|nr:oxaloacetate-decarboxylating malate dehydrogenase [Acidobacteriota bacterium]NIM61779.1 oxaloacetate-decarboxylating malate dehydrogenase [Acidobacteriota bacterium]NIO60023.1 oxaloacetate-decarboxylating malate dehydrogenase [Acidobacteriota bacterium]NIQ29215.1 oxaloacetate-decarboxylating malate dehydrogenase [Acidobacteriota bacterium]NIQ83789.1 oxaloacetate-decarboxylating malate dehydrogenase [Acidobacteriota bacterium]